MRRPRPAPAAILLALLGLVLSVPGAAAAERAGHVDLTRVEAERPVVDRVLPPGARPAPRARSAATETRRFTDEHGHVITLSTAIDGYDLGIPAAILASTRHGDEIEELRVEVVRLADMARTCGDRDAVACYAPDDPDRSYAGQMWIGADDPDLAHTTVHEYGHHVDNQLLNLGHLGTGCGFSNDGSRNWFFARELEDRILDSGVSCDPDGGWENLLGELYAEDFVALNGIRNWVLPARPPGPAQLDALAGDMAAPFTPTRQRWRPWLSRRATRETQLVVRDWTFLRVDLKGPRRSDFDLYAYAEGRDRPLLRARRTGRRETLRGVLAPGTYELAVHAYRGRGRASATIALR